MSQSADDSESTIPWPGFVDILSAVIMVFIFFVMLTVVIISQLGKKQDKSENESPAKQEMETEVPDVDNMSQEQLLAVIKENKELQRQLDEIKFTQSKNSKSVSQDIILSDENLAIVSFGDLGVTLTEAVSTQLDDVAYKGKNISLISYVPQNIGFTTMQEIALNRSFNIRNFFLNKSVSAADIKLKINTNISEGIEKCQNEAVQNNAIYGCVYIKFSK